MQEDPIAKLFMIAPVLIALAACDGPKEKAGREQDQAAAVAGGFAYNGDGPAERAGERQDRADHAAAKARNAEVDALEDQAKDVRHDADRSSDALIAQAKQIRERARSQADALKQRADQVKGR